MLPGRWVVMAAAAALVASVACAGDELLPDENGQVVYVGAAPGSDVVVGLAIDEEVDRFVVYVCGGDATYTSHTRWFAGDLRGGGRALAATRDGWTIDGLVAGDGTWASGTLTDPAGASLAWTATIGGGDVGDEGVPGLYAAVDDGCRTGVVVLDDGSGTARAEGTGGHADGARAQVTPVAPMMLTSRGLEVAVVVDGIERRLFVTPVSLPLP